MSDRVTERRSPIIFQLAGEPLRPVNDNDATWSSTVVPFLPAAKRTTGAIVCLADDACFTFESGRRAAGGGAHEHVQLTLANDTLVFVAEPDGP